MSDESETDQAFVPALEHERVSDNLKICLAEKSAITEERNQLREALSKVNAGIHKASDMVEGLAHTNDQKLITDLAMNLRKHHPRQITIKYKGETLLEINQHG